MTEKEMLELLRRFNFHIDHENRQGLEIKTSLAKMEKDIEFIKANLNDGKTEFGSIREDMQLVTDRVATIENKLSFWKGGGAVLVLLITIVAATSAFATWIVDRFVLKIGK